jgi:hypothetical protein
MKIRMLATILGTFENIDGGVERGRIVDFPDDHAKRYIANSLATASLKGELPEPYRATEESEALREWAARQVRAQIPEEVRYRTEPEVVVGGGRRKAWEGWHPQ